MTEKDEKRAGDEEDGHRGEADRREDNMPSRQPPEDQRQKRRERWGEEPAADETWGCFDTED